MNATKMWTIAGAGLALAVGSGMLIRAQSREGADAQPVPKCNISPVRAIEIAQGKVKGRTLQANFEFDEGKWVYGVMIVQGKTIKEIEIDPMSGKVRDVETVTPEGEAKEVQTELSKAIGGRPGEKAEKLEKE